MPTLTLTLPRRHEGQERVHAQASRFNVLACGRRFGKTTFGIDRCVTPESLSYPSGWFSPTYKMLTEVWREAVRVLEPITVRRSAQEHRLELVTGGLLEFWSLDNPDAARGRKYRRVVIDEAALVGVLLDAWHYVLRPTLIDTQGDAWFLSTPKGRNGFWQMHQWGQDPALSEWASWQMSSYENPKIPRHELDALRGTMTERAFNQEILAQFLEDSGGVFRRVVEAATATWQERALPDHEYIIGVDWGKSNDFTVLTTYDLTVSEVVNIDRFNQIDYMVQMGRLMGLCERFNPFKVIVESNSIGEPLIEHLVRVGLPVQPFQTTNASKTQAIDGLALGFEQEQLKIVNDPILVGELLAYEMERLPSGLMRYGAPEGMHDDCVMSLALAYYGATAGASWWLV